MDLEQPADCYCQERLQNPRFAESLKDVPPGYCGLCDVCGKPGHMRAHPQLPTTGCWCDEHWQAMLHSPGITPDQILKWLLIAVVGIVAILAITRLL